MWRGNENGAGGWFVRPARLALCTLAFAAVVARSADVPLTPEYRLAADALDWRELREKFAQGPDAIAQFEERRHFPFSKDPVVLAGEVRVSRERGISLHYTAPEERVVIVDAQGLLTRTAAGSTVPPDPRAAAGVSALLHILRMDFTAMEKEFDVFGRREGVVWALALVPRAENVRRAIGNIFVAGEGAVVKTIELRRSARQHIDIAMTPPRAPADFSAEELKRFFR